VKKKKPPAKAKKTFQVKATKKATRPLSRRESIIAVASFATAVAVLGITPNNDATKKSPASTPKVATTKSPATTPKIAAKKSPAATPKTQLASTKSPAMPTPKIDKFYYSGSTSTAVEEAYVPAFVTQQRRSEILDEISFDKFKLKLQANEVEAVNILRIDDGQNLVAYATLKNVAKDANDDDSDGVLDGYRKEQIRIEKVDPIGPGLPYKIIIAAKQAGVSYNLL